MSKDSKKTTRRAFVKKSLATSFMAGLAVNGSRMAKAFAEAAVQDRDDTFDYIIVGSGPGGGPLAVNLAKAGFKVLVLEAGGAKKPNSTLIPALHPQATETPDVVWKFYVKYYTELAQQMRNSKYNAEKGGVQYPRGATLGGSSAINALITMYPDNSDFQRMVDITGSNDFEPQEMRKMFQRLERNQYRLPGWDNQHVVSRNGYDGWLPTAMTSLKFLFKDQMFGQIVSAAAQEQGLLKELFSKVLDVLGPDLDPNSWPNVYKGREGLFTPPKNTWKGVRWGLREHLEETAKKLPQNLIIRTRTLATQVLFADDAPARAIGVKCLEGSNLYKADPDVSASPGREVRYFARREVILSGGAFNSPQLLMLSGIGDREQLTRHGIATRVHLPGVGRNLQDRHEIGVVGHLKGAFESLQKCSFTGVDGDACFQELKDYGKASTYSTNGVIVGMKKRSSANAVDPDLFMFALPGEFKGYYDGWTKSVNRPESFTWAILKGKTQNTSGTVELRSSNPLDTPEINFRFFDDGKAIDGEDMQSMLMATKMIRRINAKMPLGTTETVPGPAIASDGQLTQFVKDEAWGHHASCSNKMGAVSDPMAVVDAEFRVFGTRNLRVVDASVFPRIPGLFIALPIYMISEKASDIILRGAKKD